MVHVAGTHMIWQGTDGLSRGDLNAGVMAGEDFLSHITLHLDCLTRSASLAVWIRSWASGRNAKPPVFLAPEDWFLPHALGGCYVWTPPPAAARRAVSLLGQSIHKRPNSVHVFIAPRLMTALWRKVLRKTCDVCLTLPIGTSVWSTEEDEPLIITIALPLSRSHPWRLKGTEFAVDVESTVRPLWEEDLVRAGDRLHQCLSHAWTLSAL